MAARGRQPNLSFFAFTATPKARTLELFGTLRPGDGPVRAVPPLLDAPGDRGGLHPRRARQLHDLRDVLAGSRRRSPTTPSTTPRKAQAAIARFVSLHPHNLAQKAEIIVEHFREHTPPQDRRARPRRWSSPRRACTRSATSRRSTRYIARQGLRRHRTRSSRSPGTVDRRRASSSPSRA